MVDRLVLGSGPAGQTALGVLSTWEGRLHAVVPEGSRGQTLQEGSIDAVVADPTDPSNYPAAADSVLVVGLEGTRCRAAAESARAAFPEASLVVALPTDAGPETRDAVAGLADRVVDARTLAAQRLLDLSVGGAATRLQKLRRALRDVDGRIAIVTHDHPDPDALGSAVGLERLAASLGVDADVCYFGEIAHQENRALVNLLDLDLQQVADPEELEAYGGIALVDHSRPGVNDSLPDETVIDVVIDHHPPRAPVEGQFVEGHFVDIRSSLGATCTLVADYFERFEIDPGRQVATALLYGIMVDTNDLTREVAETDFGAVAYLCERADESVLEQVESPSVTSEVVDVLAAAIRNRTVCGSILVSGVGAITDHDALAQATERLLNMEGISTVAVYGIADDVVYVSGRARGSDVDLGEVFTEALGAVGSAGGHADMAGAQLSLGILDDADDAESLSLIVDDVVQGRLFEALGTPDTIGDVGGGLELTHEIPPEWDGGDAGRDE